MNANEREYSLPAVSAVSAVSAIKEMVSNEARKGHLERSEDLYNKIMQMYFEMADNLLREAKKQILEAAEIAEFIGDMFESEGNNKKSERYHRMSAMFKNRALEIG